MPDAVRISVSICSFSTVARAGRSDCKSPGLAARQLGLLFCAGIVNAVIANTKSVRSRFIALSLWKWVLVEMDNATLNRRCCGLRAVSYAELTQQAVDMSL